MPTASESVRYGLLIAGEDVDPGAGRVLPSIDPTTGATWAEIGAADAGDVDRAVRAARAAFEGEAWRSLSPTRRGRLMMRLADAITENAESIARVETRDNGKLYKEMLGQLRAIPEWLYYFGGLADKVEGRVIPHDRSSVFNYTLREPVGVVGVIIPWNSPVLLLMYTLAPALAAGNTVVVKPSEHASASVLETVRLAEQVGFPPGVINVVTGDGEAGGAVVDHPDVARVSFTGSDATGRVIAGRAAGRLAGVTLELGGKSANIVFADADLEAAEAGILAGIFAAAGQTCVAGSRALWQRRSTTSCWPAWHGARTRSASATRCTRRRRWARSPTRRSSRAWPAWSRRRARPARRSSAAASPAASTACRRASSTGRPC